MHLMVAPSFVVIALPLSASEKVYSFAVCLSNARFRHPAWHEIVHALCPINLTLEVTLK